MAQTVLLTGISGFIAKHCAVAFLNAGYAVRGTLRSMARGDDVRKAIAPHADVSRLEFVKADLMADDGWDAAMAGCTGVIHLASPFPMAQPRNADELVRPAVDGVLRVLSAAHRNGVTNVVQTSSIVAMMSGHPHDRSAPFTEDDWTREDGPGVTPYALSKTLAERTARKFVAEHPSLTYASVNPGLVLGPALDRDIGTSVELVRMLLSGKYPAVPRVMFSVIDVRDVAAMHVLALEKREPGGRYFAAGECLWMVEAARILREELGERARKVPHRELPGFVVRLVGLFDAGARTIMPELDRRFSVDTSKTRSALGVEFRSARTTLADTGKALFELGLV